MPGNSPLTVPAVVYGSDDAPKPAGPSGAHMLSTGSSPPCGTPALKPEKASPCDMWGFRLQQRAKWSQNSGLSTTHDQQPNHQRGHWHGRGLGSPHHVWPRWGLAWAWVLAGCLDAAICFSDESLAVWTQAEPCQGASRFYFLAQMQPQSQGSLQCSLQILRSKTHTTASAVKCNGYGMTLLFEDYKQLYSRIESR